MVPPSIVIISDLHIGEGVLDDFDGELEAHLIGFLQHFGKASDPVELVINGDFLDFAQASPWQGKTLEGQTATGVPLCFTEAQSHQKFEAIRDAHPQVFDALRRFLAEKAEHRLVVIPGNHDADLFWPSVRQEFLRACAPGGSSAQITILLERVYRPPSAPWLWIEHGHQYDPVNRFFVADEECWSAVKPPIMDDENGVPRLYECIGTRFLVRFINGLDAHYPLVDNVKPFSRFLKIFGASALTLGRGPLDAVIALVQMNAYLAKTLASKPGDLLTAPEAGGKAKASQASPLAAWFEQASKPEREKLKKALQDIGVTFPFGLDLAVERPAEAAKIIGALADHLELVQGLGDRGDRLLGDQVGTLALGASFFGDETEDLRVGARSAAANQGIRAVVMGHTHESVADAAEYSYLNTGSWTRYYVFEKQEKTQPWQVLKEGSYERFPYRLRYAFVRAGGDSVTLETWRERIKT